jgi:hypothetical protein
MICHNRAYAALTRTGRSPCHAGSRPSCSPVKAASARDPAAGASCEARIAPRSREIARHTGARYRPPVLSGCRPLPVPQRRGGDSPPVETLDEALAAGRAMAADRAEHQAIRGGPHRRRRAR